MLNNKFSRSRINVIYINGCWVSDPVTVTFHIYDFHKIKFDNTTTNRVRFQSNLFKSLSDFDSNFSINEIKEAVRNCGGDKSPGPDGFTFKFIKEYCDTVRNFFYRYGQEVIAKVLANRLQQVVHSVISDVQTACVQGRQIIDGSLIVNEVISWATKNKERLFILKVNFEKAFDSLDWNFLNHTMEQMGFSSKWKKWIRGCLNSAYVSILMNGSPTKEFKICKGLRQGDPLSPFLFIIAAEALHVTIEEAKIVGDNCVDMSHLQFADDALLLGKRSLDNARNIFRILRCFNMASGLKVDFSKSKFFGIGVTPDEVSRFASTLCFQPSSFPFVYLGLPIGANMNKTCNWKLIIEKFKKRLTAWKARSLSGGLGIGSLFASNVAMLTKWWWRFYSESNSLWKLIVISIDGNDGKIGPDYPSSPLPSYPWKNITHLNKHLSRLDISLHSIFARKVGDGLTFKFWNDHWVGESCLKSAYPRLYYLDNNKECRIRDRVGSFEDQHVYFWDLGRPIRDGRERTQLNEILNMLSNVALTASPDGWIFNSTDSTSFSTSEMRYIIDPSFLYSSGVPIRWNKNLPIKINIHS
nr:putative RNA-directed DNA polymerase, eukaryota, reverse transcriptase zinc-binding domain protein [Tanacetum cinerariifolium]